MFHVLVRHHDEPDHVLREEIQYGDLRTAFAKLVGLLMILLDEHQGRIRPLGLSVDKTIELSDLETTSGNGYGTAKICATDPAFDLAGPRP
jgi:hypothetical protein